MRVRSNSGDLSDLDGGVSRGSYQMQIRLDLVDQFAGTTVRYADIRFAGVGIDIQGQPIHSPLAGEVGESADPNDSLIDAQPIGNLMETDLAVLGIAGALDSATDVDIYQFDVEYAQIQVPTNSHVPVTIDLDYADGLGRANAVLTLFDAGGNVVATNRDANISEDRPAPLDGTSLTDLSRGSVGALDPFIGPLELPTGTYFLAVSSDARVSAELAQFYTANPSNPLLRLEPNVALQRIAEDHISFSGGSTAADPVLDELVNTDGVVPYFLGDVTLYVSRDTGMTDVTEIVTVDAFTGTQETVVGRFGRDVGDIDIRNNGDLHAYTLDLENFPATDADAGNYLLISTENGSITEINDDGIQTFNEDLPANPGNAIRSNLVGNARVGDGIHFQAIEFGVLDNRGEFGFAVGNRPAFANPPGIDVTENILYQFNPNTGVAFSAPASDRTGNGRIQGAGTQIRERGQLVTDADPFGTAGKTIVADEATEVINGVTFPLIVDGTSFSIDDGFGGVTDFEFVSGAEIQLQLFPNIEPPQFLRDGDTFFLDGQGFEIDTGEVIIVDAPNGNFVTDGHQFTVTDDAAPAVTRIFEFDDGSGPTIAGGVIPVPFNVGMTRGAVVATIVNAINGVPAFTATAQAMPTTDNNFNNRISLINATAASETADGISIFGAQGASGGGVTLIPLEEVSNNDEFITSTTLVFNNVAGITFSGEGNRGNFLGVNTSDFSQLVNRGAVIDLGTDSTPSNPLAFPVLYLVGDSAVDIAGRIETAINSTPFGLSATSNNTVVTLGGLAQAVSADSPLLIAGAAPGGLITGMAIVTQQGPAGRMYAVSDAGGLFEVINPTSPGGAFVDYIETSVDLLGIDFVGLAAPPAAVEGGFYNQPGEEILFGLDSSGTMWAFNVRGELQPVFVDGQSSISTGVNGANGLAFSTHQRNLWRVHNSIPRGTDPGHGLNALFDGSRLFDVLGGSSFHFGRGPNSDYNVVGGAYGALESQPFSLKGYSPADQPVFLLQLPAGHREPQRRLEHPLADAGQLPRLHCRRGRRLEAGGDQQLGPGPRVLRRRIRRPRPVRWHRHRCARAVRHRRRGSSDVLASGSDSLGPVRGPGESADSLRIRHCRQHELRRSVHARHGAAGHRRCGSARRRAVRHRFHHVRIRLGGHVGGAHGRRRRRRRDVRNPPRRL